MKMETIFQHIINCFREGRVSVLATLIKRTGSAPRDAGTRFLVLDDGTFHGTIGGGLFEAQVLEEAGKVIKTGRPARFEFSLTGTDLEDSEMLCGGEGEVFLELITPEKSRHVMVFETALEALKKGEAGLLATALDKDRWTANEAPKVFLKAGGEVKGSLLGDKDMPDSLIEDLSRFLRLKQAQTESLEDEKGEPIELLLEPVASEPFLYVFGGGHVSGEVVPLAARVGFKVVVVDDREEFADSSRFPDAHQVLLAPFEGIMSRLSVNASSYLVIVTRGHVHDKTVLEEALGTRAKYIGMIGSRRKINIIYARLKEEGFSPERLKRVHAPIGLDIAAETPEEIAVSIIAELIMVRAGGAKRDRKQLITQIGE
jgi:xanthine dehydrogenase accessory factor